MQLKTDKWGDVKWIGGEGRYGSGYSLLCEGTRGRRIVTSKNLEGCWVEQAEDGRGWNVVVGHEIVENVRLKGEAQDTLLEYIR